MNLLFLAFLSMSIGNECLKIEGQFFYPFDVNNAAVLSIPDSCQNTLSLFGNASFETQATHQIFVFQERHNIVTGYGHECQMTKTKFIFGAKVIFWRERKRIERNVVKVSREECQKMVRSKMCGNQVMICEASSCFYEYAPEETYSTFSTIEMEGLDCEFKQIRIESEKLEDNYLGRAGCPMSNYFCQLHDRTVIWDASIVHKCMLSYVGNLPMTQFQGNIYASKKSSLLFRIVNQTSKFVHECPFKLVAF